MVLKSLGKIDVENVEKIKNILKKIEFRQFSVETGKINLFPSESYIKNISIDLIAPDFEFLKNEIDEKLQQIGIFQTEKNYSPQIRIAKIEKVRDKPEFLKKTYEFAPKKKFFIANQFSLVKSILLDKKIEFKNIQSYPMRVRA